MKHVRIRIGFVFGVLAVGLVAVAGRFAYIQVVKAGSLQALAQSRHIGSERVMPLRGTIIDANHETLAISVPAVSLYAHPHRFEPGEPEAVCDILERYDLPRGCDSVQRSSRFVWLARNLPRDENQALLAELEPFEAVGRKPSSTRRYPKGALAGQLLGFVGVDRRGLEGVERAMDEWLQPTLVDLPVRKDARRRMLLQPEDLQDFQARRNNIQLSIDAAVQARVERALADAISTFGGTAAIALVAEADSGAIRAAAIAPSFNPNRFSEYGPAQWRTRFATDAFEPGSTVKPLVLTAAMLDGLSLNDIVYAESGRYLVDEHEITDDEPFGWISLRNVVVKSSNIGAAKIGEKIGSEALHEAYRKFGFGKKVALGLAGESSGIMRSAQRWSKLDFAAASFGQGLSLTPLQLLQAYMLIANDGVHVPLRIFEQVADADSGQVLWQPDQTPRRVFDDPEVFTAVRRVIRSVVEEGTGQRAAVEGLTVGGKTGTAQKPDLVDGGYLADAYVAWFVGMFPIEQPKWVAVVLVDEPESNIYGGAVAAPVFAQVAEAIAIREGLLNDTRTPKVSSEADLPRASRGDVDRADMAQLRTLPDLTGMSLRSAGQLLHELDKSIIASGSGVVIEQTPPPGADLEQLRFVRLTLAEEPV